MHFIFTLFGILTILYVFYRILIEIRDNYENQREDEYVRLLVERIRTIDPRVDVVVDQLRFFEGDKSYTIDKKYVSEEEGIKEIREYMNPYITSEKLDIIFQIITTMSYSTVKKNGFPLLNEYQLAYHIVREADLLAAYDIDRCIMYSMYTKNTNYVLALDAAVILFENRVLQHRKDKLFITKFSKKQSLQLHKKAEKDIDILMRNIKPLIII